MLSFAAYLLISRIEIIQCLLVHSGNDWSENICQENAAVFGRISAETVKECMPHDGEPSLHNSRLVARSRQQQTPDERYIFVFRFPHCTQLLVHPQNSNRHLSNCPAFACSWRYIRFTELRAASKGYYNVSTAMKLAAEKLMSSPNLDAKFPNFY